MLASWAGVVDAPVTTLIFGNSTGPNTDRSLPAASWTATSMPCGPSLSALASTSASAPVTLGGHGTGTANWNGSPSLGLTSAHGAGASGTVCATLPSTLTI